MAKTEIIWKNFEGRIGFSSNQRLYSVEFSLQSISSNSSLWKRKNWSVVIQTWSWCGQPAASARAGCGKQTAFYFPIIICYVFLISRCRGESDLGLCMTSVLSKRMQLHSADSDLKTCLAAKFVGSWHDAAVFFLQVPKSCTDTDLILLYILILGTYSKFDRNKKKASARCLIAVAIHKLLLQAGCVKISFGWLPNNWFVSTKTKSMKCFVNWIPLKPHVCLDQTQSCLKVFE